MLNLDGLWAGITRILQYLKRYAAGAKWTFSHDLADRGRSYSHPIYMPVLDNTSVRVIKRPATIVYPNMRPQDAIFTSSNMLAGRRLNTLVLCSAPSLAHSQSHRCYYQRY
jgi:hypothetical protein